MYLFSSSRVFCMQYSANAAFISEIPLACLCVAQANIACNTSSRLVSGMRLCSKKGSGGQSCVTQ